jgi:flagellar biosynthesis chaperone FliJ
MMQRFRFALQNVLQFRQTQLDLERARIEELYSALRSLEAEQAAIDIEKEGEARAVKHLGVVEPLELLALDAFARAAENRRDALQAKKSGVQETIVHQKQRVVEAQRNKELLEMLQEKRKQEWTTACDRELEEIASESFLSRWSRENEAGTHDDEAA